MFANVYTITSEVFLSHVHSYSGSQLISYPPVHPKNMIIWGIFYNSGVYTAYTASVYTVTHTATMQFV